MKYLFTLIIISLLFTSCFTTSLLDNSQDISSLSPNNYSLNRAFYTHDGLLHLDFNNLDNNFQNKKFYQVSLDVNAILDEYNKSNNGSYVKFKGRFARRYRAASVCLPINDTGCNTYFQRNNLVFIDFRDVKVVETSTLDAIPDSNLMAYTEVIHSDCINKPGSHREYYNENTVNSPNDVYVLQSLKDANKLLALRIPLTCGNTKLDMLPAALLLDILTSPIQFGFYVVTHKGEREPRRREVEKEIKFQPINPMTPHKPNHP